ncbi:hypothetical protein CYMTET_4376 [Cymbomonas tetramitiformis]|uniref:Uncharacterized protein n=1 Tax=Cymbomonas tetramitiformis TaxID=36881 RepID=A0AAE0LK37_9CHLO|nr:hypothetical protein CYMTET_4376 [Cymbomonas tetramitiformis]
MWNLLFGAMKVLPKELLGNRDLMQAFAVFSEPAIRFVDKLVGATNAMRVDAKVDGQEVSLLCVHDDLEVCVGIGTAAFGMQMLRGQVPHGVWFPAEMGSKNRQGILERAQREASKWDM